MLFTTELQPWQVEATHRMKIPLSQLYCIEQWQAGNKIEGKDSRELEKRGFIKNGELTTIAKDIYTAICNLEKPLAEKPKKVPKTVTKWDEEFKEFWDSWPYMRSIPGGGKALECKKEFKGSEGQCLLKYIKIVTEGKITAEKLNHAAKVYVATGIHESLRKGKNELEYMSGMLPWLNQGKYLIWENIEMPMPIISQSERMNTSIDI